MLSIVKSLMIIALINATVNACGSSKLFSKKHNSASTQPESDSEKCQAIETCTGDLNRPGPKREDCEDCISPLPPGQPLPEPSDSEMKDARAALAESIKSKGFYSYGTEIFPNINHNALTKSLAELIYQDQYIELTLRPFARRNIPISASKIEAFNPGTCVATEIPWASSVLGQYPSFTVLRPVGESHSEMSPTCMGEMTFEALRGFITILVKKGTTKTFKISAENQNSRVVSIDTEIAKTAILNIDLGEPTLVCPSMMPALSLSSPRPTEIKAKCNSQGQIVY